MTSVLKTRDRDAAAVEQLVENLQSRGTVYDFLSQLLRGEPSVEMLASFLAGFSQQQPADELASQSQEYLRAFAESASGGGLDQVATELGAEYVALFFSSWRRVISPYESVYTSREHVMLQEAAGKMAYLYARSGLQVEASFTEPADHVSLELAFMAFLCKQAEDAVKSGDFQKGLSLLTEQEGFLREHVLVWVPDFCRDLEKATKSDFYRGLAWLTLEFLETEAENVTSLTETVNSWLAE